VYLIWVMLLVLAAAYGLCAALVPFAERTIRPRGLETAIVVAQSSEPTPSG
jgi:hypothetical protein